MVLEKILKDQQETWLMGTNWDLTLWVTFFEIAPSLQMNFRNDQIMAAAKSVSRNELKFGWVGKRVTMYPNMWKMKYENFDLRGL